MSDKHKREDLTWDELKPLLMWINLPCCTKGKGVRRDSFFPRVLKCGRCGLLWFTEKLEEGGYKFTKAV